MSEDLPDDDNKLEQLREEFPRVFRQLRNFECDDGWYQLVRKLAAHAEELARDAGLDPESDTWPHAAQVKEKFGGLRFYLEGGTPEIHGKFFDMMMAVEQESRTVCERCGALGQVMNDGGYIHTSCALCEVRRKKRKG